MATNSELLTSIIAAAARLQPIVDDTDDEDDIVHQDLKTADDALWEALEELGEGV